MPAGPSELPALLSSIRLRTPFDKSNGWKFRANWICQDCSSQLQSAPRVWGRHGSLGFGPWQSWGLRHLAQAGTIPFSQRRKISRQADESASRLREDLPSHREGQRSDVVKRFSHVMDNLQSNIFIAGQRLNDLTGYSGIEALKKDIESQEKQVQSTRKALQAAREAYSTAISQRSGSQREVNELLQRKHAWSPNDLERFTALYRSDHANEQAESAAQEHLNTTERRAEEATARLSASILARYHEEQIWSDKIRRMSTWGTWGLMGVNILLFLVFQIGVEPWRRKRLVKGFEDKVMEALERESSATPHRDAAVQSGQISEDRPAVPTSEEISIPPESGTEIALLVNDSKPSENAVVELEPEGSLIPDAAPASSFRRLSTAVRDLFSHRQIVLRKVDITAMVLEGAAAGIFVTVGFFIMLRTRK